MTEIWAYQAANVIEITGNLTAKYWPNQLIKITQGTEKFFVIMGVGLVGGNTRLTVSGGGVYILTSDAITAHHMTTNAAPVGLPSGFAAQADSYAAVSKDTPIDDDRLSIWDSAANFVRKGLTWANLKATLKTYFDGLYAVTGHNHSWTYAPAANRVTNGDSHDHNGGDGAQIDHGGLGGLGDDDHTGYLLLAGRGSYQTIGGQVRSQYEYVVNDLLNSGQFRCVYGNYGVFLRNDGSAFWLLVTASGDQYGGWNSLRPFSVNLSNGLVSFGNGIYITGNCSADSFTDRTDAFAGDALAAIEKVAADVEGNIDHSTLPEFARSTYVDADGEEQAGRDIGNMVSVLTTGMQQLIYEITALKERLKKLEERIEA